MKYPVLKILSVHFLTVLLLASCDFRVERDYKNLVYRIVSDPTTLNPMVRTDTTSYMIGTFIFDTLCELDDETLRWKPSLAKKWEIGGDQLQYTFYLRNDVYWHDGVKFTADDVLYSFERINDPGVDAAPLRAYYKDVSKVEKVDDYTIKFTYAYPYYRALTMLGSIPIVPKHIFDDNTDFNKHPFGRNPTGTGAYIFKEWKTGNKIVLARNEKYWGDKPKIESITFKIIPDPGAALQVLKKGEVDFSGLTSIQWLRQTASKNFEEKFDKYKFNAMGYYFIAWNEKQPYFNDKTVRRALTMLIDRKSLIDKLYFGLAEEITGDSYKYGPDYNHDIKPIPYDPVGAVKLLDTAGWVDTDGDGIRDKNGVKFAFTFMVAGGGENENIANIVREELGKAGIEMDVARFEWAVFNKNLYGRAFDAALLGWSQVIEADPYQVWHSSQTTGGSNFINFKNEDIDRIVESARGEFDPEKRHQMYKRFQEILYSEQPYTFLLTPKNLITVQKRFTDVKIYSFSVDIKQWGVTRPVNMLYQ